MFWLIAKEPCSGAIPNDSEQGVPCSLTASTTSMVPGRVY